MASSKFRAQGPGFGVFSVGIGFRILGLRFGTSGLRVWLIASAVKEHRTSQK